MSSRSEFVLEVKGLSKTYTQGQWWQKKFHCRALDDVSLTLRPGETLAVVGKSGAGKTTLAMCLAGLERPDAGSILLEGENLCSLGKDARATVRGEIHLIFQDSAGALNPRMSAAEIVEEPLVIRGQHNRSQRSDLAEAMMEQVGISPKWKSRLPHEFSGGQRQRLAIARSLVLRPKVLLLDEIFVGLDLSIQGQIANLLLDLQHTHGLTYLSISHDLGLVSQIADRIVVMDRGRLLKQLDAQELCRSESFLNSVV